MLINFSNHPFEEWNKSQLSAAISEFGEIVDLKFPDIDPYSKESDIYVLASRFSEEIVAMASTAVHVMGEHTFVHVVVRLLQEKGIRCIASTSNRAAILNADGSWTRRFDFACFRDYPKL